MPRHPPCALNNLATKMLASTVQFSKYGRTRHHNPPRTHNHTHQGAGHEQYSDDDCQPTTSTKGTPTTNSGRLFPQDPTVCRTTDLTTGATMPAFHPHEQTRPKTFAQDTALGTHTNPVTRTGQAPEMLLRKEVIQPHLPVRLPCYDFVPMASPTFDGSSPVRG